MTVHVPVTPRAIHDHVLRADFFRFVERVYRELRPADPLVSNWHIEYLCREAIDFLEGEDLHLVTNLPPRSLKSIILSIALPAYLLGLKPHLQMICASNSLALAEDLALKTRQVMNAPWYCRLFPRTFISRGNEQGTFTTAGGYRRTASVGSAITGIGADIAVIDDAMKADEAESDAAREKAANWIKSSLLSRANDKRKVKVVLAQQRLHVDDPAGVVLEMPGTRHVRLPAIADRTQIFPLGGKRIYTWKEGEPLQAVREPLGIVLREKERMGARRFAAQMLQEPVPLEGGIFKNSWFHYYLERPAMKAGDRHIFSWDTAMVDSDSADYSVCLEVLVTQTGYYILNVIRDRLIYPDLKRKIVAQAAAHPSAIILIEDKGSGISVAQDLRLQGVKIVSFKPEGPKGMRASLASDQFEAGIVHLPKNANWVGEYEAELLAFPNGRNDDQVDATSQMIIWNEKKKRRPPTTIFGSY
ncbi:phage terminase large subunit [Mesorhizobium koreense]|uniref:phage terminase large subunit n=1 Tax=Mesorhizobium koreense TaxID=3074855 RepID=UPI00287B789F|nr:phage terminase large subunit [Mesorhizobium sp. WR6]